MYVGEGSKVYPQFDENASPLPLQRIGVILCPGFFLTFVVIHSIVFCCSIYLEFYHRKIGKLIKFIKPDLQKRLGLASIVVGIMAQIFFIAQSVCGYVFVTQGKRMLNHYAELLATFAILVMISLALNFTNYYIMGQYYRKYVNGERWNKFTISFIVKIIWLVVTIMLAAICCGFYVRGRKDIADVFEWAFHLWYGFLMAFWTYDLYPLTELKSLKRGAEKVPKRRFSFWNKEKVDIVTHVTNADSNLTPSTSQSMRDFDSPGFNYTNYNPSSPV
ncbi:hypothetical protein CANTEDRAFT_135607 [Yamadazyma tenuis ATCC 10573]|nr:uncharacterized protein CANTEDRAFT_135607 [Yamadazyma tenuis ATCC 10573]EGV61668.1 hypothetical protein CANTEDRAFT_135607 [Yamadazyma tenuis ATCC 10573]